MRRQDFSYDLPDDLIAREPTAQRRGSRLLHLAGDSGALGHCQFPELLDLVEPGDLMVFNDTRVIPARVFGKKATGGQVEVLVERVLDTHRVLAHTRASKSPKVDSSLILEDGTELRVLGRQEALFELLFPEPALEVLERIGHMPLPPYIDRADAIADRERYQTVFSKADKAGAVAAPTAGLHFDDELLSALLKKGVNTAFVTLHVGAGTFQPVRVDNIYEHQMHSEIMEVTAEVCEQVKQTKAAGKPIYGICFGHQIMADTFGGKAEKAEVGNVVGAREFEFADQSVDAHVWHKDQVTVVPPGATVTATAGHCPVGALAYDFPAASIQFHPEYTDPHLREIFERGQGKAGFLEPEEAVDAVASFETSDVKVDLMAAEVAALLRTHIG